MGLFSRKSKQDRLTEDSGRFYSKDDDAAIGERARAKRASNAGGGLLNVFGTATLTNCTISGNSTVFGGGGVNNYFGTATLTREVPPPIEAIGVARNPWMSRSPRTARKPRNVIGTLPVRLA